MSCYLNLVICFLLCLSEDLFHGMSFDLATRNSWQMISLTTDLLSVDLIQYCFAHVCQRHATTLWIAKHLAAG